MIFKKDMVGVDGRFLEEWRSGAVKGEGGLGRSGVMEDLEV